jgi:large subunit ribosomal protein L21
MFAVIKDGSRQYRVQKGDQLEVDYRATAKNGDALSFDRVLAAGTESKNAIGRPVIEGASVHAEVVDAEAAGPKLEIGKFRRRKSYNRHTGHRQRYTAVRITTINVPGLAE